LPVGFKTLVSTLTSAEAAATLSRADGAAASSAFSALPAFSGSFSFGEGLAGAAGASGVEATGADTGA